MNGDITEKGKINETRRVVRGRLGSHVYWTFYRRQMKNIGLRLRQEIQYLKRL